MTRTVAVRYAFGIVGEASREAHLATAPGTGVPAAWRTFCGVEIPAHEAEVSDRPAGMPCVCCLTNLTRSITW
ncbi:hypothetical protein ABT324_29100 [Saccharopolyspora sp. NPDC000359]|uniref:hypothetical protein n=1 Tax=Saccharopolyspora sp. NPDC000359 TaxID=3154251 RepID=UPI00332294E1